MTDLIKHIESTKFEINIFDANLNTEYFEQLCREISEEDYQKNGNMISFVSSYTGRSVGEYLRNSCPTLSFELKGGNRYVKVNNGIVDETYGLVHPRKKL